MECFVEQNAVHRITILSQCSTDVLFQLKNAIRLTTMSFPAFSCFLASFIAAAAAAPDEIPTCKIFALTISIIDGKTWRVTNS